MESITHKCGHDHERDIYGKSKAAQTRKINWWQKQLCPTCWKAEKVESESAMHYAGIVTGESEKAYKVQRAVHDPADQVDNVTFWVPKSRSDKREDEDNSERFFAFTEGWLLDKKRADFYQDGRIDFM